MAKDSQDNDALTVITPTGIVCFPHVWEPHAFQAGQEPNYSLILVFDKDADLGPLKKAAAKAAIGKWGDKAKAMKSQLRMPWRPGSDYASYGDPFGDDTIFVTAKSKTPPGIVDKKARPIMNQMDFYAGCQARMSVYCHAYDQMGNKGVTLLLNNIQKVGEGNRLSGRKSAEAEFGAVDGDDDDGDDDDMPF